MNNKTKIISMLLRLIAAPFQIPIGVQEALLIDLKELESRQ
jgi:hypothetical protein